MPTVKMATAVAYRSVLLLASSRRHPPLLPVEYLATTARCLLAVLSADATVIFVWYGLLELVTCRIREVLKLRPCPDVAAFHNVTQSVHVFIVGHLK